MKTNCYFCGASTKKESKVCRICHRTPEQARKDTDQYLTNAREFLADHFQIIHITGA